MSDLLQDEPQLPVPETKGKKGLWIVLFVVGVILLTVVFIKAGRSTKDPKKAIVEAADSNRISIDEKTSDNVQGLTEALVDSDGAVHEQSDSRHIPLERYDAFVSKTMTQNEELARDERLANDRRNLRTDRLPYSIDAYGRPITNVSQNHEVSNSTNNAEEKTIVIPGVAEGWDPEQEIIVLATDRTPAYRYRPAYLRGSNNYQRPGDLERRDQAWLNSVDAPSYGHSVQINDAFNAGLPHIVIKQQVDNCQVIHIKDYHGAKQPVGQTTIKKIRTKKKWTIPASGESK